MPTSFGRLRALRADPPRLAMRCTGTMIGSLLLLLPRTGTVLGRLLLLQRWRTQPRSGRARAAPSCAPRRRASAPCAEQSAPAPSGVGRRRMRPTSPSRPRPWLAAALARASLRRQKRRASGTAWRARLNAAPGTALARCAARSVAPRSLGASSCAPWPRARGSESRQSASAREACSACSAPVRGDRFSAIRRLWSLVHQKRRGDCSEALIAVRWRVATHEHPNGHWTQ
jgi:hypothetical protein